MKANASGVSSVNFLPSDVQFDIRMRQLANEGVQHAREYVARKEAKYAAQTVDDPALCACDLYCFTHRKTSECKGKE